MKLVSRREWGARPPRSTPAWLRGTKGVKIHYTGSLVRPALLEDHLLCAVLMGQIQNSHMDGNGWSDFAYTCAVCPHGVVFEGRGLNRVVAANGPGLNTAHYAVLGMVGNAGLTIPTREMLAGIRDAIDWCRRQGGAGTEILGHRDGYATDCPGPHLYKWVRDGAPRPTEDDGLNMNEKQVYDSVWKRDAMPAPNGDPKNPTWQPESVLTDVNKKTRQLLAENAAIREELAEIKALLRAGATPATDG